MRKNSFIDELASVAGITIDEATKVNEIIEGHSLIGRNSKAAVVVEIAEALNVEEARADEISNVAYDILAKALKEKIKHPFSPKG
ncbi:MAG: hypothetical protein MJ166_09225 [Clostridia bacterium]|nr:hypothetical protein [Clostridia bacterium]